MKPVLLTALALLLLPPAAMADFEAKEGTFLAVELKYVAKGKEPVVVRTSSLADTEMTLPLQVSDERIWPVSISAIHSKTLITSIHVTVPEETPRLTTQQAREHAPIIVGRSPMLEVYLPAKLNDNLTVVETNTYLLTLRIRAL